MGITYTRAQIRRRVNDLTKDTDLGLVLAAVKNRIISDVHRDFVERTKCNRNAVIFSLADGVTNGTLEYDMRSADRLAGNAPTLAYADYEGYPSYKLSNCDAIIKIERYVTTDDGTTVEMRPVNADEINAWGLLGNTTDYPDYYEMLGEPDTFRILPELASSAYTIKYRIWYMESVIDLISHEDAPNDTSDPVMTTGSGTSDMNVNTAGTAAAYYEFEVTTGGATSPNVFKWRKNGGTYTTAVNMTTTAQLISDGLYVSWDALTGHTAGNVWTVYQDDPQVGSVPLKFRKALVYGAISEVYALRGDERWQLYAQKYESEIARCKAEAYIDTYDKPYRIKIGRKIGQGG